MPAVAALSLIGAVVAAGVAGGLSGDDAGQTRPSSEAIASSAASPRRGSDGKAESVATVAVSTVPNERKSRLSQPLSYGMAGDEVSRLQRRLKQLRFDPGPVDGSFGELTQAAVWGFEKLIVGVDREQATGVVTAQMWSRMQDDIVVEPRRPNSTPRHTEIYLPEQMIVFFDGDEPSLISHMASGDNAEWCDDVVISPGEYGNEKGKKPLKRRECGQSVTPGGVYSFYREVKGLRQSALGGLWNPMYFNYGIAVHGALEVPLEPASHGCIRIPRTISERLQTLVELGDQVFVFDGVEEPEVYGQQPPVFNRIDPEWLATSTTSTTAPPTTTTTTTTTTVPPTTEVPTTPAPTTVAPPPPPTAPPPPPTVAPTQPPTTAPPPTRPPTTTAPRPPTTTAPPTTAPPDTTSPGSAPRRRAAGSQG